FVSVAFVSVQLVFLFLLALRVAVLDAVVVAVMGSLLGRTARPLRSTDAGRRIHARAASAPPVPRSGLNACLSLLAVEVSSISRRRLRAFSQPGCLRCDPRRA